MFTQKEIMDINVVVQTHPRLKDVVVGGRRLDTGNLLNRIREEHEALESGPAMKLAEVETIDHLREYMAKVLPGSRVEVTDDGVVINTRMEIDLGGTLYPLCDEEEKCVGECNH